MILRQVLALLLSGSLLLATVPVAQPDQSNQAPPALSQDGNGSAVELQQLVAPIALYPDALVAQILAAATYPTEIVEADRWMQQHTNLRGKSLAEEVNKQPWDPSVKALTQFPSVLANMDRNFSWTSSLGDAYVNQPQDVMDAIQLMRARAQSAGNLKNTPHEEVIDNGPAITIQPVDPDVVYLPEYDPWIVYGDPILAWPGWYAYPGLYIEGPSIAFGIGFGVGFFGGFVWGWPHWGFDWIHRTVIFNHNTYISHSLSIVNRNALAHGRPMFHGGAPAAPHGFVGGLHGSPGMNRESHSGAFSGFDHGGITGDFASRGRASFGGGFRGSGGFHGGGGRR